MNEPVTLKRTPLFERHLALGARMVPFGGWEMPVQYSGVTDEHLCVRSAVGLFDVSHMGEIELRGPRALEVTNEIISNDLSKIVEGQACYTVITRENGGIIDDLVVYRMSPTRIFICCNASNREKDFAWFKERVGGRCEVLQRSDEFAQIAVQGPSATALVQRLTAVDLSKIGTYRFSEGSVDGVPAIISRTGYTGEDGFELYVPSDKGAALWDALLSRGSDLGVKAIGLGARDSLRLEMKFALYGNDIDDETNPIEAGLGWVVKFDKGDFIGRAALLEIKERGPARKLVGFEMRGNGIARHGYPIVSGKEPVGIVTSGTKAPSVNKAIGMAYVPAALAAIGSKIYVDIRGKAVEAEVVKTPFYRKG